MKLDRFYWLIIAGMLLLGFTNLASFYLYARERIKTRLAVKTAHQAIDRLQKDTADHVLAMRKESQQKFLDALDSLKLNRDSKDALKQKLAAVLKARNQKIQRFYANRKAGVGDAMKIIREDGELLASYNQYFQLEEERQNAIAEKIKPLGNSLGFQEGKDKSPVTKSPVTSS